jgi:hypothetical protein
MDAVYKWTKVVDQAQVEGLKNGTVLSASHTHNEDGKGQQLVLEVKKEDGEVQVVKTGGTVKTKTIKA